MTTILLSAFVGMAIWQLIIFICYLCEFSEKEYFDYFNCGFITIVFFIIRPVVAAFILFFYRTHYSKATLYIKGQVVITMYVKNKDKELFNTDTSKDYYVTFTKEKFKTPPIKNDIYFKGQEYYRCTRLDNYFKERD